MGGAVFPGLALAHLPASSADPQKPVESAIARLQQRIDELEAKLQAQIERQQDEQAVLADADELEGSAQVLDLENQDGKQIEVLPKIETDDLNIVICDDGSSWLGVRNH